MGTMQQCPLRVFAASACVVERDGSDAFTDAPPDIAPLATAYTTPGGVCRSGGVVLPLSADKQEVRSAIDNLTAGGASAPHLGAAWAWYLLSPQWSYLWHEGTAAGSYADMSIRLANNQPRLRKAAVIVQSSGSTIQYCHGVNDLLTDCPSPNGRSPDQLRRLCGGMREAGIWVYSIGLGLTGEQEMAGILRDCCASRKGAYFEVTSEAQLRQAFRTIALQLSPLIQTQ